jgi:hypothetical protein
MIAMPENTEITTFTTTLPNHPGLKVGDLVTCELIRGMPVMGRR